MAKGFSILLLIVLVIGLPFAFRGSEQIVSVSSNNVVVIITAHNETLRWEYGHGFSQWYKEKTGQNVTVDWRHPGGGRDVSRYVDSMFINNFKFHWETKLNKPWTQEMRSAFIRLDQINLATATPIEAEVVNAFRSSQVGCDIDLLFGGGVYDHKVQAAKGFSVPSTIMHRRPDLFTEDAIPEFFAGERLWDRDGYWIGTSLTSFGIIYNADAIKALKVTTKPSSWMDLADPKYFCGIAIVDPTKSSSTLKSYEMLIQQQMQIVLKEELRKSNSEEITKEMESHAISEGWMRGLQLIQKIVANGRYFTDSSLKTVIDVASGDCPIGIATDFYGHSQRTSLQERSKSDRFCFVLPNGGYSVSPDPISIFRGAKHPDLAEAFIEYIISIPGQKLPVFKVGTPGGPVRAQLCRTAILKTMYSDKYLQHHYDASINPYEAIGDFIYRESWTKPVFAALSYIFKIAFLDASEELSSAWHAILKARDTGSYKAADKALKIMTNLDDFNYEISRTKIIAMTKNKDPLEAAKQQSAITNHFQAQYKRAKMVAKGRQNKNIK
ncbi:MAG: extracellular solute-binding protein [Puniceicoccales bacterium]|jgi:ABC-type Fe3+ transport system substrate-binding protein|nr:extracellular solute-binding protein [Puniceicoccales bacterium]